MDFLKRNWISIAIGLFAQGALIIADTYMREKDMSDMRKEIEAEVRKDLEAEEIKEAE